MWYDPYLSKPFPPLYVSELSPFHFFELERSQIPSTTAMTHRRLSHRADHQSCQTHKFT